MHTLTKIGGLWHVGYWTPFDTGIEDPWITVATVDTAVAATHLVSYLNGGPGNEMLAAMAVAGKIKFAE